MTNPSKDKGDRNERAAVAYLVEECGNLCLPNAQRMLGAGRAEDVGDLHVFDDVAIQVRAYAMSKIGQAVRSSARDSVSQARNGDKTHALGLVPYPRARAGTVRWIACAEQWPDIPPIEPVEFSQVAKALTWLRDDSGPHGYRPYPRHRRIGLLTGGAGNPVLLAPAEAWIAAYRRTHDAAEGEQRRFGLQVVG